jgi:SAM-dependent methyltransferase
LADLARKDDQAVAARRKLAERLLAREGIRLPGSGPETRIENDEAASAAPAIAVVPASADDAARVDTKRFYDGVTDTLDGSIFGNSAFFLNLGYAPTARPQRARVSLPLHVLDGNSVRLVLETVGDCPLEGKSVLDVGCGRGGTIVTLLKYFQIGRAAGVDLSTNAVRFCGRRHRYPNARFINADAQRLPFADESFDAVTNIESSHSYPSVEAFYAEVRRVLRPGGNFLYADVFLSREKRLESLAALRSMGFTLERSDDVTENVLRSCDEIAERRQAAFTHRNDGDRVNNFLTTPGSWVYAGLKSGTSSFWIYGLRRGAQAD